MSNYRRCSRPSHRLLLAGGEQARNGISSGIPDGWCRLVSGEERGNRNFDSNQQTSTFQRSFLRAESKAAVAKPHNQICAQQAVQMARMLNDASFRDLCASPLGFCSAGQFPSRIKRFIKCQYMPKFSFNGAHTAKGTIFR